MLNFTYHNPVRIVFGKGAIAELPKLIPRRRQGAFDLRRRVDQAERGLRPSDPRLRDHAIVEFGGIEPNPRYETCLRAVELARAEGVDSCWPPAAARCSTARSSSPRPCPIKGKDPWDMLIELVPRPRQPAAAGLRAHPAGDRLGDERRGGHQPRGDARETVFQLAAHLSAVFDPRSRDHLHAARRGRRPTGWSMRLSTPPSST